MNPLSHRPVEWLVGVDIGQARDPTAIAVLQRVALIKKTKAVIDGREELVPVIQDDWIGPGETRRKFSYVDHFHLRQLVRLPLRTPYAGVVDRVADIVQALPPYAVMVVIDQTGVGRPVAEMMHHLPMVPVTITSGQSTSHDHDGWKVSKKILVSNAQILLQNERLRVAGKLEISKDFVGEMMAFRVKTGATSQTFEAGREGPHDDLVLAVCLGLWWGTQRQTGWLTTPPYPEMEDADEDGPARPHPRAGQPQDFEERMLDSGLVAARKKFGKQ